MRRYPAPSYRQHRRARAMGWVLIPPAAVLTVLLVAGTAVSVVAA